MVNLGATPYQIAEVAMQNENLRNAIKSVFLKDIDEQCRKLCTRKDETSSVLRVPHSKHKVIIIVNNTEVRGFCQKGSKLQPFIGKLYSWLGITRTFKGNWKGFELSGVENKGPEIMTKTVFNVYEDTGTVS